VTFTDIVIRLSDETLEEIDEAIEGLHDAVSDRQEFLERAIEFTLANMKEAAESPSRAYWTSKVEQFKRSLACGHTEDHDERWLVAVLEHLIEYPELDEFDVCESFSQNCRIEGR
jgi:hypothetical protein